MDKFFLAILAFIGWSIMCGCVGWWFHDHPDKFVQYTGFVGDYVSAHWLEHKPVCPSGYTCVRAEETPAPSPTPKQSPL